MSDSDYKTYEVGFRAFGIAKVEAQSEDEATTIVSEALFGFSHIDIDAVDVDGVDVEAL